jgi:hypothetical protein
MSIQSNKMCLYAGDNSVVGLASSTLPPLLDPSKVRVRNACRSKCIVTLNVCFHVGEVCVITAAWLRV